MQFLHKGFMQFLHDPISKILKNHRKMLGGAAVRSFVRSTSVRSAAAAAAKLSSAAKTSPVRFSAPKPLSHRIFRCPVELSVCLETVQPFHTVTNTASAFMTSTFVFSRRSYGCLPEGS